MARHKYKTLNDVPHPQLDAIADLLRAGQTEQARDQLHEILIQIKDIPQFEVFMLTRKLKQKAGLPT